LSSAATALATNTNQYVWNLFEGATPDTACRVQYPESQIKYSAMYDDTSQEIKIYAQKACSRDQPDPTEVAKSKVDDTKPSYLNLPGFNLALSKTKGSQTYNYGWFGNQNGKACANIGATSLLVNASGFSGAPSLLLNPDIMVANGYWVLPTTPLTATPQTNPYGTFYTPVGSDSLSLQCGPYTAVVVPGANNVTPPKECLRDPSFVPLPNPIPTSPMLGYAIMVLLLGFIALRRFVNGGFADGLKMELLA
jgi:hypothetical protein